MELSEVQRSLGLDKASQTARNTPASGNRRTGTSEVEFVFADQHGLSPSRVLPTVVAEQAKGGTGKQRAAGVG